MSSRDTVVVAGVLRDGTDDERLVALASLPEPVDASVVAPLLDAVERGGERVRTRAAWKISRSTWLKPDLLDAAGLARGIAAGRKHADPEVFIPLLRAEPAGVPLDEVARAVFEARLSDAPFMRDALDHAAQEGRITPACAHFLVERAVESALAAGIDGGTPDEPPSAWIPVRIALRVAERVYDTTGDRAIRRVLLRTMLSPGPQRIRADACWALTRAEKDERSPAGSIRFRLAPADVEDVFGHPRNALLAFLSLMTDDAALRQVGIYDWLADLFRYRTDPSVRAMFAREPEAFRAFLSAAVEIAKRDYWLHLRTGSIQLLEKVVVPEDREWVVALLDGFGAVAYDLEYWVERVREKLIG